MNAGPPAGGRSLFRMRARVLTGLASTALSGIWPLAAANPGPPGPQPLTPRQLLRSLPRRTRQLAMNRLTALPCFDAGAYLAGYPDVQAAGFAAAFHALWIGAAEGRTIFPPGRLARVLGTLNKQPLPVAQLQPAPAARTPMGIYVSSQSNAFMHDIARCLAAGLGAAGVPVTLRDETAPGARQPPLCVFVAPHEFFRLGQGPAWINGPVLSDAVMLNTEQAQTPWFAAALPFLLSARAVLDLSPQQAALFASAGVPSCHLTLAPEPPAPRLTAALQQHSLFRVLPTAAQALPDPARPVPARPLDIAFFGAASEHRSRWFARNAGFLSGFETFLYCRREGSAPMRPGSPDGALPEVARHVCGHSKIILNLHRDAFGYFEWHRMVQLGMAGGSVVVSEPCPPHPVFRPGVQYLEAPARHLPGLIEWLLRTEDGAARAQDVRDNAAWALGAAFDVEGLLSFLAAA